MCKVKLHHNKCLVVLIVVAELTIYNSCIYFKLHTTLPQYRFSLIIFGYLQDLFMHKVK